MFNLRSLDLNLLTVFEAIYEVGTVSGSADRLALSQSAASHALARLRDGIVTLIFVRQPEVRDDFAAHITLRFGRTCPAARH